MNTLDNIQNSVKDIVIKAGWDQENRTAFELTNYLTEEVGEVCREVRRLEVGRKRPDEPDKITDLQGLTEEIGDVLCNLADIANYYNISLEDAYNSFVRKISKRYNI